MAYYFIFPEKDATIYSHPDRLKLNTGHDEILEIVKEKGTSDSRYYPSRALIKFNNTEIQTALSLLESFRANSFSEANITNNLTQVFIDNKFVNRKVLPLSLSYDHRIIDGAEAARFCNQLKENLGKNFAYKLSM